jgi:predicted nucleic acid-binding protein
VIFVDTSAFYAVLDRDDEVHELARAQWAEFLSIPPHPGLVTSNYVLVESFALSQARLGMEAARTFQDSVLPVVQVHWITPEDHGAAVHAVLSANRRGLSLVDCASFQLMRRLGIRQAFVFDRHFTEQGFETLPG